MMRTSTLLLAGPNKLSRVCLKSLFEDSSFTVIGEVSDIAMINSGALPDPDPDPDPDIVLFEIAGDSKIVLDALERLNANYPDTPIVVLSDRVCMATLVACFSAGARGFLTKDILPGALLRSLELAVLGETVFPAYLAGILVGGIWESMPPRAVTGNACGLSGREMETVQCLLHGESNKQIARRLRVTEATIKVHMKSAMRKIKANNRTQAAIWAHGQGQVPIHDGASVYEGRG